MIGIVVVSHGKLSKELVAATENGERALGREYVHDNGQDILL